MITAIILTALAAAVIAHFFPALLSFYRRYRFAQTLPGISIADLHAGPAKSRMLDWLQLNRERFGTVYHVWLGLDLAVHVSEPDLVRTILSSSELTHKAKGYNLVRPWLGNGLLTNGGAAWHQRRKQLTPAFHFQTLSGFKQPMEECADVLIGRLAEVADGERAVDVYQYVTLFALDVICETAMGIKVNAQLNQTSEFVQTTYKICGMLHRQIYGSWKRIAWLYALTAECRERDAALRILHGETQRVIRQRRQELLAELAEDAAAKPAAAAADEDSNEVAPPKRRRAFLDSLLVLQQQSGADGEPLLSDQNIQEEVDTFMFEGHDTTSSAISFTLLLLSRDARVQQLVLDEVLEQGGMRDANQSMPYLEAVLKESQRLYPAVAQWSRETHKPFQLGAITIPKDVTVTVSAYPMHHDPELYPQPERFWPERWLDDGDAAELKRSTHPYAQVAFSAGPRNCIGQRFAMLELKCTLSRLVREFEWLPVAGFVPDARPELVVKSANGVQVRLRRRPVVQ